MLQLKDALKAYEEEKSMKHTDAVYAVLDKLEDAIRDDPGMQSRPKLLELITPRKDPARLADIAAFRKMAMNDAMRLRYFKDVLSRLTDEVNAPEGGRRRRKTRKTRRARMTRRR